MSLLCLTDCCRFVEDPAASFPVGLLVEGRLLSASPASSSATTGAAGEGATRSTTRLEMTLK